MKGDLSRSGLNRIQILRPETKTNVMAKTKAVAGLLVPSFVGEAAIKFKPTRFKARRFKPGFAVPPAPLGRLGPLEVRLALKKSDVRRAQKLRYKVFYKNGTAIADATTMLAQRDKDAFDPICDHLLVIDHAAKPSLSGKQPVVGTYRLLRQEVAERNGGFYTDNEFNISDLVDRNPGLRFLELGRSCVLPPYRNKRTVELL